MDARETPSGSWTTLYGIGLVGLLILLVACFNFMNLATARASLRAREIALRKTLGAQRRQLIVQFLGEAVLMALLSLLLRWRWWKSRSGLWTPSSASHSHSL